jgi:leucyl-tRNA synthetase
MIGSRRWLDRVWDLQERVDQGVADTPAIQSQLERTVRKVTHDIESFKFNTAISALMEMTNSFAKQVAISSERYHRFLQLLAPFVPHLAEELYELTGGTRSIQIVAWPEVDEALAAQTTITLPVQVNGKTRATLEVAPDISEAEVVVLAQDHEAVKRHVADQIIVKVLYVPGKILNLVTKPGK